MKPALDRTQTVSPSERVCLLCVWSCKLTTDGVERLVVDRRLLSCSSTGAQPEAAETRPSTQIHISRRVFALLSYICLFVRRVRVSRQRVSTQRRRLQRADVYNLQGRTQSKHLYIQIQLDAT